MKTSENNHCSRRQAGAGRSLLAIGLALCMCAVQLQQVGAILNCFTPKMFNKLGKGGQPVPYPGGGGGPERANWYPQYYMQQAFNQYPQHHYGMQAAQSYPSMKSLLFQPKWPKGGGSLLGNKNWASSWKMAQMGSHFYRPGFGYGYSAGGGSMFGPMAYPQLGAGYSSGYGPTSDTLLSLPGPSSAPAGFSPVLNTHPSASSGGPNDGWTVPVQHQIGAGAYEPLGYTHPAHALGGIRQPTIDPYGSVKGGATNRVSTNSGTTKKASNILVADGGYSAYDAHLVDPFASLMHRNRSFGYSYPDSYLSAGPIVDSPAKIAQQLMKYGLKQQRHQQQTIARLAPLILANQSGASSSRLVGANLLEEPKFVGFGVIDVLNNREARLSCSFNEPIEQASAVWIKFLGPYNSTQMNGANIVPPFNCPSLQCRTQEIDPTRDGRFRFDNGPATSTLIISEPQNSDYGVYRCAALSKVSSVNNNNNNNISLNTIYKIVQLADPTP